MTIRLRTPALAAFALAAAAAAATPYPWRILYWLAEDGSLHAKIEGTRGGKPASEEWSWRRQSP